MKTPRSQRIETALMVVAVACAVTVTIRSVLPASTVASPTLPAAVSKTDWSDILAAGQTIGSPEARIRLAVFTDLECPYCKSFATDLWPKLVNKYGDTISLSVVHFPLEGHQHALQAARALECAGAQGKFDRYFTASEGHEGPLTDVALLAVSRQAGVPDSGRFAGCLSDTATVPAIAAGLELASRLRLTGTPAIVVQGKFLLRGLPTFARLDSLIQSNLDS